MSKYSSQAVADPSSRGLLHAGPSHFIMHSLLHAGHAPIHFGYKLGPFQRRNK